MKKLFFILLASGFVFYSCKKDSSESNANVPESKVALNNLGDDIVANFDDVMNSEAGVAMNNMFKLMDTENPLFSNSGGILKRAVLLTTGKTATFNQKSAMIGSEPFDYNSKKGVYTWNPKKYVVSGGWDKTTANNIVIKFPKDSVSTTNDVIVTIDAFSETSITNTDGTTYLPTDIKANLVISSKKLIDIDFTAAWNQKAEPTSLTIKLTVSPLYFEGSFTNDQTNSKITLNAQLDINSKTFAAVGGWFTYSTKTDGGIDMPLEINGFVQLVSIKLVGSMNNEAISSFEKPTSAQINDNLSLKLVNSDTGDKIADIVAADSTYNGQTSPQPKLKFVDGSEQWAEVYLKNVLKAIDAKMGKYIPAQVFNKKK